MKIKTHYILFALLVSLISKRSTAQITTVVDGVTCTSNSCSHLYDSPGTLISSQSSAVNFSGTSQINYVATDGIQLLPGFVANAYTGSGYFHAYTDLSGYDVVLHPQNNQVPEFEKAEFSIQLPSQVQQYITNFVSGLSGTLLNPFDPDQISVEATFTSPTNVIHTIYGFYYRNFQYAIPHGSSYPITSWTPTSPVNDSSNTSARWEPDDSDPHTFKVRFSPDELGNWKFSVAVKYPTGISQNYTFSGDINFYHYNFNR